MPFTPDVTPGFVPDSSAQSAPAVTSGFVPDKPNPLITGLKALVQPISQTFTGKSLQEMSNEDAAVPASSRPFDANILPAEASQNMAIVGDMLTSPISYVPLPIELAGKPIGALLEKFAPNIAKSVATQFRGINPEWNARLNSAPVDPFVHALDSAEVAPTVAPVQTPTTPGFVPDENPQYQAWLEQNAQSSTPQNPIMDVPLHPLEDTQAALAQIPEELPGQNGQLGFRDFPQGISQPPAPANTQDYLAAIQKYTDSLNANKAKAQGQQEFDFTKGPETPNVPVFKNTGEAAAFGVANKDNPAIIDSLQQAYNAGLAQVESIKQLGDKASDEQLSQAFTIAQKNQLYREAVESAKGTGGFKRPLAIQPTEAPKPLVLPDKQLGFRDILNRKTLTRAPEAPPEISGEPFGPFRGQGQQQFDFTQGPPNELPDSISELRKMVLTAPEEDLPAIQAKIRDLATPDRSDTIIPEVPPEPVKLSPREEAKQKLVYNTLKKDVSEYKMLSSKESLSAVDELRLEDLAKKITGLKKNLTPEQLQSLKNIRTPSQEPSAMEDAATILRGLNKKGSLEGGRYTPEAQEAIQRFRTKHAPELAEHLKTAGNTVEGFLARKLPTFSDVEIKNLAHYMTPEKLGSSNISLQNMSPEKAQAAKDLAAREFVDLGKSAKGEPLTREESIGRAGTQGAADTAEALSSIDTRDAASGMTRLGIEANQALEEIVGKKATPEIVQKASDALESFKRAGTAAGRLLQSRKNILANAQEFGEQARILYENGDITKEAMQWIQDGIDKLKPLPKPVQESFWRGLHEYTINSMLSVMSNFRNFTGNASAAPLAPLTRTIEGGVNMLVARPLNKLAGAVTKGKYKPFTATDALSREAGQMIKSYIKEVPTGLKVGGRYFMNENSSAVYRGIQKDIAKVTNNASLSDVARAKKLAGLNKQKDAVLETIRGGNTGDNFAEQGSLAHKRSISGPLGYVINTPVRALSAMDQAFRIPMRKGLDDAIRLRIGIKTGTPWQDVKLTPEQLADATHEAAYYTYNQALGKVGKGIQAAAQPTSALGLAFGQTMVFMKNAINIGKFALDHGALDTGKNLFGPMVGPLYDMYSHIVAKRGVAVGSKSIAKVIAGLGMLYTSYAALKKSGVEFYQEADPTNPDEATERKAAGIPTGVYAKDANGGIHDLSQIYPLTFFFNRMAMWDNAERLKAKGSDMADIEEQNRKTQLDTFLNASTLTGPQDILSMLSQVQKEPMPSDRAADEMSPVNKYLSKQLAARSIPAFFDEINRMYLDKTQRDPNTTGQFLEQRIPGLSQNVPAKLDWTGKPIQRPSVRSPFTEMTVGEGNESANDPVQKELLRLGIFPAAVGKSQNGIRFTQDERRAIQQKYGPVELGVVKQIMADPNYQNMPEFMKFSMLSDALKVQHVGEQETAGNHALANMSDYFNLQKQRLTKGRSITGDNSTADIFTGSTK